MTREEIKFATDCYAAWGLPGCIGSTDCVHIPWDRCPAAWRATFCGAKGHPTIAYEVTCGHNRWIYFTTSGNPGTRNDKTIVREDDFVMKMKDDGLYQDEYFYVCRPDGTYARRKGLWLVVDGGYHRWRVLQCPVSGSSLRPEAEWSHRVCSVRKDVECVFGILKARFRILKLPQAWQKKEHLDNVFSVCCALHNRLLLHDGLHARTYAPVNRDLLEDEVRAVLEREGISGAHDPSMIGRRASTIPSNHEVIDEGTDHAHMRTAPCPLELVEAEDDHYSLREDLIVHYQHRLRFRFE